MHIRTVLFDLDGTLADTAPDLARSLNVVLEQNQRQPLAFETIRPVVSHGGQALIELGFGLSVGEDGFDQLRQQLLDDYAANIAVHTRLFPGMSSLIEGIIARDMNWGIVTNKPGWLTEPLLQQLEFPAPAVTVVSGDTLAERKPHPAPMLHACLAAGSEAAQCIYLGDAERDIEAGRRAGMHTAVALFGYIADTDQPESWQADLLIQHPEELLTWIDQQNCGNL